MERLIGMRILTVGLLFCVLGCDREAPKPPPMPANDANTAAKEPAEPPDPLGGSYAGRFVPAADGTVYLFLGGKAFWLVDGEATEVASNEDVDIDWYGNDYLDANGGLYCNTGDHLWYLKGGRMKKVPVVVRTSLANPSPKVSARTLLWAAQHQREVIIQEKAYEFGRDAGYSDGRDEATEGRE